MPKIILIEYIKIILHPKFERYWEIVNGTLIFQLSSMICIGNHVGGHTLALQHSGQNYFLLISCLIFDSYAQMCFKCYHIIFSIFSLKFKCKIRVQREVIHNFKNHILVT